MPKIIDANIQLPILVERIEPNPIIVPKPTLISRGSNSIEVEQTFQCDVDYYGGVGIEQNGDVDAKLVKNPNTMTATLTGLSRNTEYTIKGVGLSILGNETISEGLVVRTKANPIPDEYQLVEYLGSNGLQYISVFTTNGSPTGIDIDFQPINSISDTIIAGQIDNNAPCIFFGTAFAISYAYKQGSAGSISVPITYDKVNVKINFNKDLNIVQNGTVIYIANQYYVNSKPFLLFNGWYGGPYVGAQCRIFRSHIQSFINTDPHDLTTNIEFKLYSVYRKSDNKPGMYDIVNNVFYTNQGSGEFTVGPNKGWEE